MQRLTLPPLFPAGLRPVFFGIFPQQYCIKTAQKSMHFANRLSPLQTL